MTRHRTSQSETRQIQASTLRAAFAPATFNTDRGTVEIVWTTGAKGLRHGWDGDAYYEELSLDGKAVRLQRLNNGAPLLAAHDSYSLDSVIGVVERAWIANGEGRALVRFSERPEAAQIMNDVRAGILQNVSVGYTVYKYERIRSVGADGKSNGGIDTYRAVDWEPMELSIVPIGFDDGAKVRSHARAKTHSVEIITRRTGQSDMKINQAIENQTEADDTNDNGEAQSIPNTREAQAAIRAERARTSTILSLVRKANLSDSLADELIRNGTPLGEARIAIIDLMAEEQQRTQGTISGKHLALANDYESPEFRARAIGEALFARFNHSHKPSEAAQPYCGLSLVEIARECLHSARISTRLMSPAKIIERALGGLHGTSDFALALGDSVARELLRSFENADRGVIRAAREVPAPDFRLRHKVKISEGPKLEKVDEHGEFRRGTITEGEETYKIDTYGKIFGITRQALVNDNMGAFADLARRLGVEAREFESQMVVDLLVSGSGAGPLLSDGVRLFHANHNNLAASGAALSSTSLGVARAALRLQKGLSGRVINVTPKYLVVPASLESLAEAVLSNVAATKVADVNVFGGKLELITDPRLDAASALAWYVAADPAQIDGLEVARLDGVGPVVDTQTGFDVDGVEFRVRLDMGAGFVEHRSWYRNPGA